MKVVLTDHGKILHWAGAHHLFPVRGTTGPYDVSFASHGELNGRVAIGWNEFFPAVDKSDAVIVADEDEGTLSVLSATAAAAALAGAPTAPASSHAHH
jgi:hypothetical protein